MRRILLALLVTFTPVGIAAGEPFAVVELFQRPRGATRAPERRRCCAT